MPSNQASRVIYRMQEFLERKLSKHEIILCEEMVYNIYTNAIVKYVERVIKKNGVKTFESVYYPMINGVAKTAWRRGGVLKLAPHVERLYWQLHDFLTPNFSEFEFEHILWLAEVSPREMAEALTFMKSRGIGSAAYLRATIFNRRKQDRRQAPKPARAISTTLPRQRVQPAVDLEQSRTNWKRKAELSEVELNAGHHTRDQAKGTAS